MSALSIFVQWIALILVLVPAFLADAPPQPILAALLGVTGGLMLAVPPSIPLPRKIGWASLVFFVTSAMAFLPDNWFQEPAWRKTFRSTGEIALSRCSTLQPWHTGWGLILIGAGLLFGLFLLCNPVNRENHFRLATFFTIGIGIYAGVSILAVETGWKHPWAIIGSFGFLPNRNHVGTLLVMGGVAGLGPLNQAISKKRWGFLILLLIALGGIFTAITVYNVSRAAVPLLMGGCLLWVAGVLGRPLSLKQATFSVGLLGIACYFFIHSNAPSSQRLGLLISGKSENSSSIQTSTLALDSVAPNDFSDIVPFDFRWLIYKDTLDLIADHPVQGVGLGNYRYLIPQYRKASLSENTMLHSDSSVLLIAAETGIPALISVVVLLTLCWLRLKGCAAHHSWNVRWSSAVAFLVFLIHSTFDIPAHRTATLLPALFIAGLAFRPPSIERINEEGLRLSRFIFSGFGLALLVTAGWLVNWIPIGLNAPLILPVESVRNQIYTLHKQHQKQEAKGVVQSGLKQTPLASIFYHQWGELEMGLTHAPRETERLFATERILEPCFVATPLNQAEFWIPFNSEAAIPLFTESMNRAIKQEKRGFTGKVKETYAKIVQTTLKYPELTESIRRLAGNDPRLLLEWMKTAPGNAVDQGIAEIRSTDPDLNQWPHPERREFFRIWHKHGNRRELMKQINQHSEWSKDSWPVVAADFAVEGNYQKAWSLAAGTIRLLPLESDPLDPPLSEALRQYHDRKSPETARALTKAYFLKNDWDNVIKMTSLCESAPILRMASLASTKLNLWNQAWEELARAIRLEDPTFSPE